jgi:hypothetical protein
VGACLQSGPVRQDPRARWSGGARRGQEGCGGLAVKLKMGPGMIAIEPEGTERPAAQTRDDAGDPGSHMEVCPRCGQTFDGRILHQVIYHEQREHKPIPL